jgi:hypothetical protein
MHAAGRDDQRSIHPSIGRRSDRTSRWPAPCTELIEERRGEESHHQSTMYDMDDRGRHRCMQMDQQASLHIHWLVCSAVPALAMHFCTLHSALSIVVAAGRAPARPAGRPYLFWPHAISGSEKERKPLAPAHHRGSPRRCHAGLWPHARTGERNHVGTIFIPNSDCLGWTPPLLVRRRRGKS